MSSPITTAYEAVDAIASLPWDCDDRRKALYCLMRHITTHLERLQEAHGAADKLTEDVPNVLVPDHLLDEDDEGRMSLARLMVALGLERTMSLSRRVIAQGGVTIGSDRALVDDVKAMVVPDDGLVIHVGKRKAARIVRESPENPTL